MTLDEARDMVHATAGTPSEYLRAILVVLLALHDRADAAPTPAAEPSPSPRRGR